MPAPTIHNSAKKGEIARTVLMPGDPKRAAYIAENFLEDARLVNDIRCDYAYTGKYKGKALSVMASGMGAGSMGIYSYELFNDYDVERIIRVGSAGGLSSDLELGDVVVALSVSSDSGYMSHFNFPGSFSPTVSGRLLKKLLSLDDSVRPGPVYSGAAFHYSDEFFRKIEEMGMLCIEMETAALYTNAAAVGREALSMFTISDIMSTGEHYSGPERETAFNKMIVTALNLAFESE